MSGKLIQIPPLQPGNEAVTLQWIVVQKANNELNIYSPAEETVSKGFILLFLCLVQTQICQGDIKTKGRWISRVGPVIDREVKKQSLPHHVLTVRTLPCPRKLVYL